MTLTFVAVQLVLVAGWYGYRVYSARQRRELGEARSGLDAPPELRRARPVFMILLAVVVGGPLLMIASDRWEKAQQRRHPPVTEHRAELIELAVRRVGCPQDRLTIIPETPVRARVTGCGKDVVFHWTRDIRYRTRKNWQEVDPNCTFNFMGSVRPCD